MATNLSIDPALIERALEVSGERTKEAAVTRALGEFIARRRQKQLLELMGKLEWDTSFDYKAGALAREPVRGHERLVACAAARRAQRFFGSGWKMITSALASSPTLRPRCGIVESM